MQLFKKALHPWVQGFLSGKSGKSRYAGQRLRPFCPVPFSVEEGFVDGHAEVPGDGPQVVVLDGLANQAAAHGQCRFVKHLVQREIQRKQQVFLSERARQEGA